MTIIAFVLSITISLFLLFERRRSLRDILYLWRSTWWLYLITFGIALLAFAFTFGWVAGNYERCRDLHYSLPYCIKDSFI